LGSVPRASAACSALRRLVSAEVRGPECSSYLIDTQPFMNISVNITKTLLLFLDCGRTGEIHIFREEMMARQSFASMSLDALVKLRGQISSAISDRAEALKKQLSSLGHDYAPGRGRGRPPGKRRKIAKVKVKYRDPKTGEKWAGRGAPARWIAAYEKQGRKRDEFLIKKPSGAKKSKTRKAKKVRRKKR
jgi:DNA-binding protein H-NS